MLPFQGLQIIIRICYYSGRVTASATNYTSKREFSERSIGHENCGEFALRLFQWLSKRRRVESNRASIRRAKQRCRPPGLDSKQIRAAVKMQDIRIQVHVTDAWRANLKVQ